ncbi:response regulator transcription factor [Neobacillus citreus]|uniref:Response regulator transcription factor n=1 Tax=Neobacillus citreus TaxID=2833578 RepID=A0A942YA81_9BACI|nr:response regulator transcription factor [Neobacillus citreus]MCH6267806.1 response regulator transcription factor [Neobacillus citreus]
MKTIVLVDDETRMLDLLGLYLTPNGYRCIKVESGKQGLIFLQKEKIDLVILDVMMPEMDGWMTCQKIREFSDVPIIMVTARSETADVVKGLKKGADDYITKPFHEAELLARVEALLRRSGQSKDNHLVFKGLEWKEDSVELKYRNQVISTTPKEFALIGLFLRNPQKVFSREHLLSAIWGLEANIDDRTIDSHIRNLRDKLRNAGFPINQHLFTVWGVGYKWVNEGSESQWSKS